MVAYRLTRKGFKNYSSGMDAELNQLEEKINQLILLTRALAQENQSLKALLNQVRDENIALQSKMQQASSRVESLLADLPETLL